MIEQDDRLLLSCAPDSLFAALGTGLAVAVATRSQVGLALGLAIAGLLTWAAWRTKISLTEAILAYRGRMTAADMIERARRRGGDVGRVERAALETSRDQMTILGIAIVSLLMGGLIGAFASTH